MKSLMLLWKEVAFECATLCHTSAHLDCKTVEMRVKNEGKSFFTITLPQFGKDFEKSLDQGWLDKQDFQGFSWKSGLPKLLSGFLCQIFDTTSGRLLEEPSIAAIRSVRQLTLMYGKLFELTTRERERKAMDSYLECEQDVARYVYQNQQGSPERDAFARIARIACGEVLRRIEVSLPWGTNHYSLEREDNGRSASVPRFSDLVPLHGPGATADGLKGNQKWRHNTWTQRLEEVMPMADFLIPNFSYYEKLDEIHVLEPEAEIPVKVVSVPKTQKTPRIIAVEPTVQMFAQKALQNRFYEEVERDYLLNSFIGFRDQAPNQRLAMEGSLSGDLATLDLSEASDRVSCQHVEDLCRLNPALLRGLMAVRSTKADVDGKKVITLAKYASMGSALTFPLEALVFLTIVLRGIEKGLKRSLTRRDLFDLVGKVRVYGDDIIVPVEYVSSVVDSLESFGMKVNHSKSFWTGKFRESCGKEYYAGEDVSIVRIRQNPPATRKDAQAVISWVESRNQFYKAGYWSTCRWLDSLISGILQDYPVVGEFSPVLGRHSFLGYETQRIGGPLQSPLVKGWVVRSVIPRNTLDDHFALHKWFSLRGDLPIASEDHLERSGRPRVVGMKRGWYSPF